MNKLVSTVLILVLVVGVYSYTANPSFEGKTFTEWKEVWTTGKNEDRLAAAYAFGEMGSRAKDAVPLLREAMMNGDGYLRLVASVALRKIDRTASKKAGLVAATPLNTPDLVRALKDRDRAVRHEAVLLLGEFRLSEFGDTGPFAMMADKAVPPLVTILESDRGKIRVHAAKALGAMGPAAVQAVPQLAAALQNDDTSVRIAAANALGEIGPSAKESVRALVATFDHRSVSLRAVEALGKMGPAAVEAVPALIDGLDNEHIQRIVPTALGKIGVAAQDAVPALAKALSHGDMVVRDNAARALGEIGPGAAEAVPALINAVASDDFNLRRDAVIALGMIGHDAREAVPTLIRAMGGADQTLAVVSKQALAKIDPQAAAQASKTVMTVRDRRTRARENR